MAAGPIASWSFRANGVASITIPLTGQKIQVGDTLHVVSHLFATASITAATPTDDQGASNTYANNPASAWDATFRTIVQTSRCESVVAAPTQIVVGSTGTTGDFAGVVYHIAFQSPSPSDTASTALIAASATPANAALTTGQAYTIVFLEASHDGANLTPTPPPGFTLGPTNFNGSAGEPYASAWRVFTEVQTALVLSWGIAGGAPNDTLGLTSYKILPVTATNTKSNFPKQVPR